MQTEPFQFSIRRMLVAAVLFAVAVRLASRASTREAIAELRGRSNSGPDDFVHLDIDPDLNSRRKLPDYRKLMRQHRIQRLNNRSKAARHFPSCGPARPSESIAL